MADAGRRTGFAQTVGLGLASAAVTAVASAKPWFRAAIDYKLMPGVRDPDRSADMPLSLALSLVVLAGWGVVLVVRGRARRAALVIALLCAIGVVACLVTAPFTLPDQVRESLPGASGDVSVSVTGWYAAAGIAAVLTVVVLAMAWWRAPSWPTMSTRYDAPTTRATGTEDTDLWKALDAGQDPTDPSPDAGRASP